MTTVSVPGPARPVANSMPRLYSAQSVRHAPDQSLSSRLPVEPFVPHATDDHLHYGLHRPFGLRHCPAAAAALRQTLQYQWADARPSDGVVFGDAVSVCANLGADLRPRREAADPRSGIGRLGNFLCPLRL